MSANFRSPGIVSLYLMSSLLLTSCFSTFQTAKILDVGDSKHLLAGEAWSDHFPVEDVFPDVVYKYRRGVTSRMELGVGVNMMWPQLSVGGKYRLFDKTALDFNVGILPIDSSPMKYDYNFDISIIHGVAWYKGFKYVHRSPEHRPQIFPFIGKEIKISQRISIIPELSIGLFLIDDGNLEFGPDYAWNIGIGTRFSL